MASWGSGGDAPDQPTHSDDVHKRRSLHHPGRVVRDFRVVRDLAVTLADGGDRLTDLGALRDQQVLFGRVVTRSHHPGRRTSWELRCADPVRSSFREARRACAWLWRELALDLVDPVAVGGDQPPRQ